MIRTLSTAALLLLLALPLHAADSPQFRGPDRNGVFPETGLLDSWPESGPKMTWSYEGLGDGFASVSVADGRIVTTGKTGGRGTVYVLDLAGKLLWKQDYGPVHSGGGYPGSRTTPTVAGGALYLVSSAGNAASFDLESGGLRWQVDLLGKFRGDNIQWGITESPLVLDDKVIVTPGGRDGALVALDAATGETVWATPGIGGDSAYCSARLLEHGEHRQIVTFLSEQLIGVDPESGKLLWKERYPARYDIHAVSPVFEGDRIYVSDGYGQGGKLFRLAADGRSVTELWAESKLDVHHGGVVLVDGRIYGAASRGSWYALDVGSGEILASIPRLGKGSVVYADGHLYGYLENGEVVLVDPDPENFRVISSFEIEKGSGQHWAHPVISDGVLYVRHGEVLMAFDVRDRTPPPPSG